MFNIKLYYVFEFVIVSDNKFFKIFTIHCVSSRVTYLYSLALFSFGTFIIHSLYSSIIQRNIFDLFLT